MTTTHNTHTFTPHTHTHTFTHTHSHTLTHSSISSISSIFTAARGHTHTQRGLPPFCAVGNCADAYSPHYCVSLVGVRWCGEFSSCFPSLFVPRALLATLGNTNTIVFASVCSGNAALTAALHLASLASPIVFFFVRGFPVFCSLASSVNQQQQSRVHTPLLFVSGEAFWALLRSWLFWLLPHREKHDNGNQIDS